MSRINWCEGHQCGSTYMVIRLSDNGLCINLLYSPKDQFLRFWKQIYNWELSELKISGFLSQPFFKSSLKCSPRTSAVTNNPNQNVYHLPPSLCILWHPLVCLARLVFTCQLYCPAHVVFRIRCFLLCSSVLCRDYVNTEFSKALGYR